MSPPEAAGIFPEKKQCQPAENHKTQSHINRSHNGKTHFFIYAKPVFSHIPLLMTDRRIVCMPGKYNLSVLFFNRRILLSGSFVRQPACQVSLRPKTAWRQAMPLPSEA